MEHIINDPKHELGPLILKFGNSKNLVRELLLAADGKLPHEGIFKNIKIIVAEYEVYIRGCVHEGVPKLGTFFIEYKK